MRYHFFSTLDPDADSFINDSLNQLRTNKITPKQVFKNLKKVESYDSNNNPYFPEADMTKEVKYDVVENMVKISGMTDSELWDIYDEVYN